MESRANAFAAIYELGGARKLSSERNEIGWHCARAVRGRLVSSATHSRTISARVTSVFLTAWGYCIALAVAMVNSRFRYPLRRNTRSGTVHIMVTRDAEPSVLGS